MLNIRKNIIPTSLLLLCLLGFSSMLKSQNWESLNGGLNGACRVMYADTTENYLYAAGVFNKVDGVQMKGIARWNGNLWDSLSDGIDALDTLNPYPQNTLAITRYNGKLFVGGTFASLGDKAARSIGTWDGTNWDTLSPQPFKTNYSGTVFSMEVIGSDLYFGGIFDSVAGSPCKGIAKWNGASFTNIGFPPAIDGNSSGITVNSICEYNGELYIGGNFDSPLYPNDTIQDIIRYDGINWRSVGGGMKGGLSNIQSMVVYNSELYVAGYFAWADGNVGNHIQKWNGTTWSDVGGGVGTNGIGKLLVFNNKLYAMGVFDFAGGQPAQYVAEWDGTNWCGFGSVFDNVVLTGCVYNDSLYIGGGFSTIDSDSMHSVSKWIGGMFTTSCGNTSGVNESLNNLESLLLYPNPGTNQITLEFELIETKNISIEIKNILGQTIKTISDKAVTKGNNKIEIGISEFSNGLYFVNVISDNIIIETKKMIKE